MAKSGQGPCSDDPGGWARLVRWHPALAASPDASRSLVVAVPTGPERARLLDIGYGDVVGTACCPEELRARLARLARLAAAQPWRRHIGAAVIDRLARTVSWQGKAILLHPRECDILWALAGAEGASLSRMALLHKIWGISFDPGTNRVEVHVCRLRQKLRLAGIGPAVLSGPDGYRLDPAAIARPSPDCALPLPGANGLDAGLVIGNDAHRFAGASSP